MDTLTKVETVKVKAATRFGSLRNRVSATLAMLAAFVVVPVTAANASTTGGYTDPTAGAGDSFISGLQDYFLNQVVVKALGLMVITVSIGVLVAWGRKAIKSR
jgi:hypothetical protein